MTAIWFISFIFIGLIVFAIPLVLFKFFDFSLDFLIKNVIWIFLFIVLVASALVWYEGSKNGEDNEIINSDTPILGSIFADEKPSNKKPSPVEKNKIKDSLILKD